MSGARGRPTVRDARPAGLALAGRLSALLPDVPLTPRALCAEADRRAGRPDAAPDEVAEPLDLLCQDLADPRGGRPPSPLGRRVVHDLLLQGLVLCRQLQALPAAPAGLAPVVIVGWYRTGTTALQHLLAALPGHRFVPLHRLQAPVRTRGSRLRARLGLALTRIAAPELPVVHPLTADGPEEDWALLLAGLLVDGLALHLDLPRYGAWLQRADRAPAYRLWAQAIAHLTAERGGVLVLKDPQHLRAMPLIAASLPDARLVWTHREPVGAVASAASLVAMQHRSLTGALDLPRAGRRCLARLADDLRVAAPAGHLAHLALPRLQAAPVEAVRGVCAALGLPFDADAVAAAARALPASRHVADLAATGLSAADIHAAVGDYAGAPTT